MLVSPQLVVYSSLSNLSTGANSQHRTLVSQIKTGVLMADPLMSKNSNDIQDAQFCGPEIELREVTEGEQIISRNYLFSQLGKAVPIQSKLNFLYDSEWPLIQPLVVSKRFHLLFVAHKDGFYAARTEDVMESAKKIKDDGNGLSIQELSIANISIGKVSILALSAGDSVLAASVGNQVHFFLMSALHYKETKPSYSLSLEDPSCIRDMKWSSRENNAYVILSSKGKLYHGSGLGSHADVMDNVDSVEWSPKADFLAVARKNRLTILSSEFVQKMSFLLSPKSLIVDSIRWARSDSIVLGCFEGGDDCEQANYLVQVICSQSEEITDAFSKRIVYSFNDIFLDQSDVVHASGPNLFLSYLDHYELAFVANRNNISQHVVLLHWSSNDKKKGASVVELANDAWYAHIESQENGDDNCLLALAVDKVPQKSEVKFVLGEEETEVPPSCILLCLTVDGKLAFFYFASAVAGSVLSEAVAESGGKEVAYGNVLSENLSFKLSSSKVEEGNIKTEILDLASASVSKKEPDVKWFKEDGTDDSQISTSCQKSKSHGNTSSGKQEENTVTSLRTPKPDNERELQLSQDRLIPQSVFSKNPELQFQQTSYLEHCGNMAGNISGTETKSFANARPHSHSSLGKVLTNVSSPSVSESLQGLGRIEFPGGTILNEAQGTSSSLSSKKVTTYGSPGGTLKLSSGAGGSSQASGTSAGSNVSVQNAPLGTRNQVLFPSFSNSTSSLQEGSGRSSKPHQGGSATQFWTGWSNSDQILSKELHNVVEIARSMDYLMEVIEGTGGFVDASIANQQSSVTTLEESLWCLSEGCTKWKEVFNEQLAEMQLLLDRTVQALARKTYIEGIFKQATDSKYWNIWNCQKLSSELDLKRRQIMEVNEDLTSQLLELERYFNALELSKFGENRVQINQRAAMSRLRKSSQIQSLHSLRNIRNTMVSQITVADKLSECLSEQMAALRIESQADKQNIKSELFETIGLACGRESDKSPGKEKNFSTPRSQLQKTSFVVEPEEVTMKKSLSQKNFEPESVRRCQESLDKNWSSYETPRTTVKRMLGQNRRKMSNNKSPVKMEKQSLEHQPQKESVHAASYSTPLVYEVIPFTEMKETRKHPLASASQSDDGGTRVGLHGMAAEDSPALLRQPTPRSVSSQDAEKDAYLFAPRSSRMDLHQPETFKSSVSPANHTLPVSQSLIYEVICKASPSPSETLGSTRINLNEVSSLKSAERKISPAESLLSSISFDVPSSKDLSATSSYPKQVAATSPKISASTVVSSANVNRGTNLMVSQSQASSDSVSNFPSTLPISTVKTFSVQAATRGMTDGSSLLPVSVPQSLPSKAHPTFEAQTKPFNSASLIGDHSKNSTSVLQIQPFVMPEPKVGDEIHPTPATDFLCRLNSENQLNMHGTSAPSLDSDSNDKARTISGNSSRPATVNSETLIDGKSGNSTMVPQEDEMEEEVSEVGLAAELSLENLGGFGSSSPDLASIKANPFGLAFQNQSSFPMGSSFTTQQAPRTEFFRPATFSFQPPLSSQPSQPTSQANFTSTISQVPKASGFGQPSQIGALGTVLGTFGQSRQIGGGSPGVGVVSPSGSHSMSTMGGGFATLGLGGAGGFAAAAPGAGGFAAAATGGGGFAAAATASGAGFGAFGNNQGGGFSSFGGSGSGKPTSELFTQMRK